MADATVDGFKARFPTFTQSDAAIEDALEEAKAIHDKRALATLFLVAHFLTLDAGIADGTVASGEVESEGAGPLKTAYVTQAESGGRGTGSREAFYTRTEYGRRFLNLEKRTPGFVIGARAVG